MAIVETGSAYPPELHVLRDLAFEVQPGVDSNRVWMPVNPFVCNERGRVHAGLVITMIDAICGGLAAVTAAPGWIATADLTFHAVRPLVAKEIAGEARVKRAGRTTIVLTTEVHNENAETLAVATATFSVLPRRDSNPLLESPQNNAERREAFLGGRRELTKPVYDLCGFERRSDGAVEVAATEYIRNSLGGIQGGILGSLADAATVSALGDDFETVDMQLTYLALAKAGPIRATPSVVERHADAGTVAVELRDVGAERTTTRALCKGVRW